MRLRLHLEQPARLRPVVGTTLLLLLTAIALAPVASAISSGADPAHGGGYAVPVRPAPGAGQVLYSQNVHDSGVGLFSERPANKGSGWASRGVDDFTVPAGSWTIDEVDVTGRYHENGRATSENVAFYQDAGGAPGAVVATFKGVAGTDNGTGSLTLPLGNGGVTLAAGTYWLAVVVQEHLGTRTFWTWQATKDLHGSGALWRNPAGGFSGPCREFSPLKSCVSENIGPDFMFVLQGSSQ